MVGMLVVFYFFIIRPQQKKQKDQKKFINEIKKGDSIITIGGIHGKIFEIMDDTIILEVEKGGKMKLEKSSISLEASKKQAK
jgi:preprotein translocase subunit YajC